MVDMEVVGWEQTAKYTQIDCSHWCIKLNLENTVVYKLQIHHVYETVAAYL